MESKFCVLTALNIDAEGLLLDELPFLRYVGVKRSREVCECSNIRTTLFNRLLADIKVKYLFYIVLVSVIDYTVCQYKVSSCFVGTK